MWKTFDVETKTVPISEFDFKGDQATKAEKYKAERAFRFRNIGGNLNSLPNYIKSAIKDAGYRPVNLGGTTNVYTVIGLVKEQGAVGESE